MATTARRFLAAELKQLRDTARLTNRRLGEKAGYSESFGWQLENGSRAILPDMAARIDAATDAGGWFARLASWVYELDDDSWFHDFVTLEARALSIRLYDMRLVPGLLQTRDYATAVITAVNKRAMEDVIPRAIADRMARQSLLDRSDSVPLHAILDEAVLCRPIGSDAVTAAQLDRLLSLPRNAVVQVLPFSTGIHGLIEGPLTLLRLPGEPPAAAADTIRKGRLIEDPTEIHDLELSYDELAATALSPELSAEMIAAYAEEYR